MSSTTGGAEDGGGVTPKMIAKQQTTVWDQPMTGFLKVTTFPAMFVAAEADIF